MTPFAKGSHWPLLNFIKQFNNDEDVILCTPKSVQKDEQVWAAIATSAGKGLPITQPYNDPPLSHFSFASDAVGRQPPKPKDETGMAAIGFHKTVLVRYSTIVERHCRVRDDRTSSPHSHPLQTVETSVRSLKHRQPGHHLGLAQEENEEEHPGVSANQGPAHHGGLYLPPRSIGAPPQNFEHGCDNLRHPIKKIIINISEPLPPHSQQRQPASPISTKADSPN
jgi:hypothetical protein